MKKDNQQHIKLDADTFSLGDGLSIYAKSDTKNIITVTNNRAHYFANLAKKFRDEARVHCENAQHYAEENSNVTYDQLISLRNILEAEINTKQDSGDYALNQDIPVNISELNNDLEYMTNDEVEELVDNVLPAQDGKSGKFLTTNGSNMSWVEIPGEKMFSIKTFDHILSFEESKGYALQGTYVYKTAIAGERFGYPDFYAKCLEEKNAGVPTQTTLGASTITTYVNANGHKFYNISDKDVVDDFFNTTGLADFYGVDTTNERIFLPRGFNVDNKINKRRLIAYEYPSTTVAGNTATWWEIYSDGWCRQGGWVQNNTTVTFNYPMKNTNYIGNVTGNVTSNPASGHDFIANKTTTSCFIQTLSQNGTSFWWVEGELDSIPEGVISELEPTTYLYYVVGNTVSDTSWVDIVSDVNGAVADIVDAGDAQVARINAAGNNYDNLTYKNISNCLLEVPQRIKYTLEDGILTIKAGSVVIFPYGTEDLRSQFPVGSTFLYSNFKVVDTQFANGKFFVWAETQEDKTLSANWGGVSVATPMVIYLGNESVRQLSTIRVSSGDTAPTETDARLWYDTTANKIKFYTTGVLQNLNCSLPILLGTKTSSNNDTLLASIDQVFNGIGYIGSTIWVDKGVKGLIPNGRNEDDTLKNTETTSSILIIKNISKNYNSEFAISLFGTSGVGLEYDLKTIGYVKSLNELPAPAIDKYYIYFVEDENKWFFSQNGADYEPRYFTILGTYKCSSNSKITGITQKKPFRAENANELSNQKYDGQWIITNYSLATGLSVTSDTNSVFDLSNYLPNDGFDYEVMIYGCTETNTANNSYVVISIKNEYDLKIVITSACTRVNGASQQCASTCICPVGSQRFIQFVPENSPNFKGTINLIAKAYRRIGTNQ